MRWAKLFGTLKDPQPLGGLVPRTVIDRWAEKVHVPAEATTPVALAVSCWQWTGAKTRGYGYIGVGSRTDGMTYAHIVAYEYVAGPVPEGLQLDHVCHNDSDCAGGETCLHRACVNPWHLEAVTGRENTLRGGSLAASNAVKTHCPSGHAYDEANTYAIRTGGRRCRACNRDQKRAYRRKWA